MCQNCMTMMATRVLSAVTPDGGAVTIAELPGAIVNLESQQTGATFTPPPSVTLLLLSPGPDTLLFSLDHLMEAFLASLFVLETIEREPGHEILKSWAVYSPNTQKK